MDAGKIKKILSAEFSITPNGIISINGFDYTKNDAFEELERVDFTQRLAFHQIIWKDLSLLRCLEKNVVESHTVYTWEKLKNDKDFVHFISPYFADSFDKIMRKLLNPTDFNAARNWLQLLCFIDNIEDEYKALSGVRIFLAEFIRILKNSNDVTYFAHIAELQIWVDQSFHPFINRLPDSLSELKEELVVNMVNFIFTIQKVNHLLCFELSKQMISIAGISRELNELAQSNHKILLKIHDRQSKDENVGCRPFLWLLLIPIVISILKLLFGSFGGTHTNNSIDFLQKIRNSSSYFELIRQQYSVLDSSIYFGDKDQEQMILTDHYYYLLFKAPDTTTFATVDIVNNGRFSVVFSQKMRGLIVSDFVVKPGKSLKIKSNAHAFDLILNMDEKELRKDAVISPFFIANALPTHADTTSLIGPDLVLKSEQTDSQGENEITIEIYSDSKLGIHYNCFRFLNTHWFCLSKRYK